MFEQYYNNKIRVFVLLTFTIDLSLVRTFVLARRSLISETTAISPYSHSIAFQFYFHICAHGLFSFLFFSFVHSFCFFLSFFLPIRSSLPSLNSHKLLYFIWLSDDMTIDWRRKFSGECSCMRYTYGRAWIFTLGFSRPINVFIWNALILELWRWSFLFLSFSSVACYLLWRLTILKYDSIQVYLSVLLLIFFLLFRSLWILLPTFELLIDRHLYHWSSNKLVFLFRKRVWVCVCTCVFVVSILMLDFGVAGLSFIIPWNVETWNQFIGRLNLSWLDAIIIVVIISPSRF